MKTVIEELRRKRDFTIIIVIFGLPVAVVLGVLFGDAMMWLGLLIVTIAVVYHLRIKCPYCNHPVLMKERRSRFRCGYFSPAIWDYCPSCHRDLTLPYDRELCPSTDGLTK